MRAMIIMAVVIVAGCVNATTEIADPSFRSDQPEPEAVTLHFPNPSGTQIWAVPRIAGDTLIFLDFASDNTTLDSVLAYVIADNGSAEPLWYVQDGTRVKNGHEAAYAGAGERSVSSPRLPDEVWRSTQPVRVNTSATTAFLVIAWIGQPYGINVTLGNEFVLTSSGEASAAGLADFQGGIRAGSGAGIRVHSEDVLLLAPKNGYGLGTLMIISSDYAKTRLEVETAAFTEVFELDPRIDPNCIGFRVYFANFAFVGSATLRFDTAGEGRTTEVAIQFVDLPIPVSPTWEVSGPTGGQTCSR